MKLVPMAPPAVTPAHVAIVALGPSASSYLELVKRVGGRRKFCDETWGINAIGDTFVCDRIFHMDDVRIQEIRAAAAPDGNIASMLKWMKTHPGPIITSRAHPDYPGLVNFPLRAVVASQNFAYFNSTVAYAIAYAVHLGVKRLTLFGMDFTYAHSHDAEKGRACVEFWLGRATAGGSHGSRGIKLAMPQKSSLMDACNTQAERLYGYDTLNVKLKHRGGMLSVVGFEECPGPLPTAAEIEQRYDHSAHPNPIVAANQRS